jgi:hypothetical protein
MKALTPGLLVRFGRSVFDMMRLAVRTITFKERARLADTTVQLRKALKTSSSSRGNTAPISPPIDCMNLISSCWKSLTEAPVVSAAAVSSTSIVVIPASRASGGGLEDSAGKQRLRRHAGHLK